MYIYIESGNCYISYVMLPWTLPIHDSFWFLEKRHRPASLILQETKKIMTVQVSAGIQWIFGAEFSGIRQGDVQIKVRRTKAAL